MNKKSFYEEVAQNNDDVQVKNVRSIFFWYDLLAFSLSFQLLYIFAYSIGITFATTTFSTLFIIIVDTIIKEILIRDNKNYVKLHNQLDFVKLWAIPLVVLGIATMIALIVVEFGLI